MHALLPYRRYCQVHACQRCAQLCLVQAVPEVQVLHHDEATMAAEGPVVKHAGHADAVRVCRQAR